MLEASERAAREHAVQTHPIEITAATELEAAFGAARRDGAGAIHVLPSPYFNVQRRALVDLAARYRLPAVYPPSVLTRASQLIE
jgi:hypothetical protein